MVYVYNPFTNNLDDIGPLGSSGVVQPSQGGTGVVNPTAHTLPVAEGAAPFNFLGPLTNGQVLIGSAGVDPVPATITAGVGIAVTNGAGSITIATTGSGFTWNDATSATVTLAVENGYVTDRGGGVVYTLPATAVLGDEIAIVGKLGTWSVSQNANQQILLGSQSSTAGITGSIASTNVGDCVEMVCITAGASTIWRIRAVVGNITVT
jgi:hypothetical protein